MTRVTVENFRRSDSEMAKLRPTRLPSRPWRQYRLTRPADNPSLWAACSVVSSCMLPAFRFAGFNLADAVTQGVDFGPQLFGRAARAECKPKIPNGNGSQVQQVSQFAGHVRLLCQWGKAFNRFYCTAIGTLYKPGLGIFRFLFFADPVRHDGTKWSELQ